MRLGRPFFFLPPFLSVYCVAVRVNRPAVNVSGPAEQDLNHRRWFHRETMRETSELSEQHEAPHARLSSESEKEFLI